MGTVWHRKTSFGKPHTKMAPRKCNTMHTCQLHRARVYIVLFTCLLLAACTANGVTQQTSQYQQWKNQAVQHYRYQLEIHYAPQEPLVVNIEVRNGKVVSETDATTGGAVKPPRPLPPYNTIERLFALADKAENRGADDIPVVYDPTLGYPTRISLDEKSKVSGDGTIYMTTDNGIGYTVTSFEILD